MTSKLRRTLLTLLLPLALLLAQLGALQHGIGHLAGRPLPQHLADAHRAPADGAPQSAEVCVDCLATAMPGGLPPAQVLADVPMLRDARPAEPVHVAASPDLPERRSRDPPRAA